MKYKAVIIVCASVLLLFLLLTIMRSTINGVKNNTLTATEVTYSTVNNIRMGNVKCQIRNGRRATYGRPFIYGIE